MTAIDLNTLSLEELKALQKDLAKAITGFEDRQKSEARGKIEAIAKEFGFDLAELIGSTRAKSTRAPVAAKYRHPENPEVTWSGRGRRPLWFVAALEAGKRPEDLAV